ncbi:hypothetical protein [Oceanirhabdus sp. W0125-5]|uniref:hypothetical protein n=1 Tax=Oceanirhabdus sp. W0125-5 TaxID=2999116 RepID=UPI0022F33779|nr:hypothetical protein [Oceanirhabdus sp. W0125-5]WBW97825.1 hypothetical protein OW730_03305 [Oceanirhabdus sp. W0125-5]
MKKFKYIGVAVVVLLALIVGAKFLIFNATPTEKLFSGMKKAANKKNMNHKINLSFEVMNTDSMTDILNDINIELLVAQDKTGTKTSLHGNILLSDEALLQGVLATDGQLMYFELIDLYEKFFYIDSEEILKDIAGKNINGNILTNKEYLREFKLKGVDQKKYEKAFEDALGDNIKKVDGKINLRLNLNTLVKVIDELVKVAENDKKLKEALYVEGKQLLEKIKEDETIVAENEKYQIDMMLNEFFKDKETFTIMFDEGIANLKQQLELAKEQVKLYGGMVTVEADFDIDMFNNIKKVDFEVTVPGFALNASIDNTVKVDLKEYNKEDGVNFIELQDSEEAYTILQEVMNNLSTKITSNDRLIKYLEENEILEKYFYGVESVDQLLNMFVEMIMFNGVH